MTMTCNSSQFMYSSFSEDYEDSSHTLQALYPYPLGELDSNNFSLGRIALQSLNNNKNSYQIEFRILSPIKFSVESSRNCQLFDLIFSHNKLKIYEKLNNKYELNIKHFFYVLSRIKDLQEKGCVTFSFNSFDRDFINVLAINQDLNNDIKFFIESNAITKTSIIESLKCDKQYAKSAELLLKSKIFDKLNALQLDATYIGIKRNGRCILADQTGKSLEAIIIMTYFKKDWPLLIVCNHERKSYWSKELDKWLKPMVGSEGHKFRIKVINKISDIYTYPNPFHDIMIIDYDLYYEVKDSHSFKQFNLKSYIFEHLSRGSVTPNDSHWKGLSKCFNNLKIAKRICFICSNGLDLKDPKRLFPLLHILDSNTFNHFGKYYDRYCEDNCDLLSKPELKRELKRELEILLKSTVLIKSVTTDDQR